MEINIQKEEKALIVSVSGRMDAVTAPEFERELVDCMNEGEANFIIDLGQLDYISSAGLRSMLITAKRLKAMDGQILLSSLRDTVKEIFEISGFSSIIPTYESVENALSQI
ncbi:MAG: STAS domain-containing protein [Thermodesulfobacteriota bacterium]|nr:STAS domain-containing protein [Thermodesulfobacteriota bacterium]